MTSAALAIRSGLRRRAHDAGVRLVAVFLGLGLTGACGSATPTAPTGVSGDRLLTSDIRGLGASAALGAFATAPDSPTL